MKKLYSILTTLMIMILLVGCMQVPNYTMDDIENDITILYANGDDQNHVTQDLVLPTAPTLDVVAIITWRSNQPDYININGVVTRGLIDQEVDLTYTIVYQSETRIGTITINVLADRPSINDIDLAIVIGYAEGDSEHSITQNIILPSVSVLDDNATITWTSSDQNVMSNDGVIIRPEVDTLITLFYTITYHEETFSDSVFLIVLKADTYYTVTFDSQGGSSVEDIMILEEMTLDEPNDPTKVDYTFVGWYSDASLTVAYNFDTSITSDLTLYAKWSLIEVYYTVTFDTAGGSLIDPRVVLTHSKVQYPEKPTKEGFTFSGWYTDETYDTAYDFNTLVTSDDTLYAKWVETSLIDYTGIYDGAEGLSGTPLISFLYNVVTRDIAGNEQDYGSARYTLDETDQDPNNANNLILVYLGTSISGVWDSGNTWNREHVWPQSLLGVSASNGTVNKASDLHNLKPADPSENSSRSNKWYGSESTYAYEPRDEVKGDVARIIFYMAVRYYSELTLVNLSGSQDPNTYEMGDLATLLLWNEQDPVDSFEMNRNDLIEGFQGNRNPFIDYSEFADYIWG